APGPARCRGGGDAADPLLHALVRRLARRARPGALQSAVWSADLAHGGAGAGTGGGFTRLGAGPPALPAVGRLDGGGIIGGSGARMAYQSLYRKWRPQTFAAMVGQEHVARTLANAVREERMAHAYLFTGPRGTGKTSAARLFAKALDCAERVGGEPCDRCASCVAIRDGRSLDVLEIDGASNRGIDEIRDLRERVGMAPSTGPFRFYIIDEVHQLTEAAFNALLKTLEEPPAHVIFILATTDAHKVPATISSRCQHFSFHRHNAAGTRARLTEVAAAEGFTLEPAALEQLVQVADGSLRDALSILDQAVAFCGPTVGIDQLTAMLGLVPQAAVAEFAGYLRERNLAAAVQMPHRLAEDGF